VTWIPTSGLTLIGWSVLGNITILVWLLLLGVVLLPNRPAYTRIGFLAAAGFLLLLLASLSISAVWLLTLLGSG